MTRGRSVLLLLVLAGAMWLVSTRELTAAPVGNPTDPLGVAGGDPSSGQSSGSPILTAIAAAYAVTALLLAMLGTVGRRVVGVLMVLLGLGFAGSGLGTALGADATAWAWAAVAVGVIAAVVGGWIGFGRNEWHANQKFERTARSDSESDPEADPTAAWDALSRGEDPDDPR